MLLDVNNNEVVRFTATLEKLRMSALPSAIRGTLNTVALNVKQKTMPSQAQAKFINRTKNGQFFKANSRVDFATGWNVNGMKSTVGFFSNNLRGKNNFAVQDLEEQEYSGDINAKSFIPLDSARQGGAHTSLVKPANRLTKIQGIINADKQLGSTKKQKFIKAVIEAGLGPAGYVLGSNMKGEEILWRVDSFHYDYTTGRKNFSLTPLYDYRKGRSVKVDETKFMRTASLNSAKNLNKFYIAEAEFRIKKYKK